jgi:hypothetical protein
LNPSPDLRTAAGIDAEAAWRAAAKEVIEHSGPIRCMTVAIEDATKEDPAWFKKYETITGLRSVAEVLAPSVLLDDTIPRAKRYERCWDTFARARRRGLKLSGWTDTYFERLTKEKVGLESIIEKIQDWQSNSDVAFYLHTDFPQKQALRPQGAPCLQYVHFHTTDDSVSLSALYRSHDYSVKALGNFIGLTRLARFVAMETGRKAGSVLCVSLHAYCANKTNLKKLVL